MMVGYIKTVVLALALAFGAFTIGWIVALIGVRQIERRDRVNELRDIITRRSRIEGGLEARVAERRAEMRETENATGDLSKRRLQLENQLVNLKQGGSQLIRVMGDEHIDRHCFLAQVSNKYVTGAARQEQRAIQIDSSWGRPQTIEIWAKSFVDAKAAVEKRYPPNLGFYVHSIGSTTFNTDDDGKKT